MESKKQRFEKGTVAAVAAAHATHDSFSAFLPPLLPVFVKNLALSRAEAGLLSVFLQAPSVLQPWLGRIGDRWDPRPLLVATPAITVVAMSLLGIGSNFAFLAVLLSIAGVSSAALHAVGPALIAHRSGTAVGRGMGFWMVGGEVGRTLGPLLIALALRFFGLHGTPWLMVLGIGASLALARPIFAIRWQRKEAGQQRSGAGFFEVFDRMRAVTILLVARAFLLAALTTYLPLFLHEGGVSLWISGAALALVEGAGVIGAMTSGHLSDSWGRRTMIGASLMSTPVLLVLMVVGPTSLRPWLLVPMGLAGLSFAPVLMAAVQDRFPQDRGLANGVYQAINFVIRSMVVVAVGAIADVVGIGVAYLICAGVALATLPAVFFIDRN